MDSSSPVVRPERFVPILEEIRELLLDYESGLVDLVTELIDLAHLESPELVERLQFGGVWGASGSLSDLQFSGNVFGDPDLVRKDDLELGRLMLALAEEMNAQGIGTEATRREREWASEDVEATKVDVSSLALTERKEERRRRIERDNERGARDVATLEEHLLTANHHIHIARETTWFDRVCSYAYERLELSGAYLDLDSVETMVKHLVVHAGIIQTAPWNPVSESLADFILRLTGPSQWNAQASGAMLSARNTPLGPPPGEHALFFAHQAHEAAERAPRLLHTFLLTSMEIPRGIEQFFPFPICRLRLRNDPYL